MKHDGKKIAGVVAWDTPMAKIANLPASICSSAIRRRQPRGHDDPLQVTMDEMLIVSKAVRRGVARAPSPATYPMARRRKARGRAPRRDVLVKEAGADIIKVDAAADFPDAVRALSKPASRCLRSSG